MTSYLDAIGQGMAWIEWMRSISMITVLRMAIMRGPQSKKLGRARTESRVGARSVRPKRVLDLWLPSGQHQYEGDSTLLARRGAGSQGRWWVPSLWVSVGIAWMIRNSGP